MNHCATPRSSATIRRALLWISLLLLPPLPAGPSPLLHVPLPGRSRRERQGSAVPYLPIVGAPALRFQENVPPPDVSTRPAAAAPPRPASEPAESAPTADVIKFSAMRAPAAEAATALPEDHPAEAAKAPKAPAPILHDKLRREIHPEDFLPYFQFPGSRSGKSTVIIPTSLPPDSPVAPLPPSSATYTRTPE